MTWSQAGGSLKADSAGVWWSSMPFSERMNFASFIHNQEHIEEGWSKTFGDRKNELVFIGQDLDKEQIISELEACLCTESEVNQINWEQGEEDTWQVLRAVPPHLQQEQY